MGEAAGSFDDAAEADPADEEVGAEDAESLLPQPAATPTVPVTKASRAQEKK
ncbi:MAG: hypothetical protein ABSF69_08885 [Polyangiaceae bacterium]|jgi:hypothetical protein